MPAETSFSLGSWLSTHSSDSRVACNTRVTLFSSQTWWTRGTGATVTSWWPYWAVVPTWAWVSLHSLHLQHVAWLSFGSLESREAWWSRVSLLPVETRSAWFAWSALEPVPSWQPLLSSVSPLPVQSGCTGISLRSWGSRNRGPLGHWAWVSPLSLHTGQTNVTVVAITAIKTWISFGSSEARFSLQSCGRLTREARLTLFSSDTRESPFAWRALRSRQARSSR